MSFYDQLPAFLYFGHVEPFVIFKSTGELDLGVCDIRYFLNWKIISRASVQGKEQIKFCIVCILLLLRYLWMNLNEPCDLF